MRYHTVTSSIRTALAQPSVVVPALVLLLPTLIIQLGAVTHLRTRLAPEMWTVVLGSIVLIWWTQVATPAICALVHALRNGARRPALASVAGSSLAIGTLVTVGLALAVLPGLWLQARYAFAPLREVDGETLRARLRLSAEATRPVVLSLVVLSVLALVASGLGQGAVAGIAEWMGAIVPVATVEGRTIFELRYVPHAVTSVLAYVCTAVILTVYAVGVSAIEGEVRGVRPTTFEAKRSGRLGLRFVQLTAAALVVAAAAAAVYKVQQHL